MGLRENFAGLMMVDDDGFHAELGGVGQRIMGKDTAIQGEQQVAALLFQKFHRVFAGAIAFGQPVGHVDDGAGAHGAKEQLEDCSGGNAIDIIVTDDPDAGLSDDCLGKSRRPLLHILQGRRLRHEAADRWIEEGFSIFKSHTARRHDAAENFRQFISFGNGLGQALILQARDPAPAAQ